MFEDDESRLFAMTLGTILIQARHRQAAFGFEDIKAVRIMALNTIHLLFQNGVMLGQLELPMRFDVAIETRRRIIAWINDVNPTTTTVFYVKTSWTLTRLAADSTNDSFLGQMETGMRA